MKLNRTKSAVLFVAVVVTVAGAQASHPGATMPTPEQIEESKRRNPSIDKKIDRAMQEFREEQKADASFLAQFMQLPANQRVEQWKNGPRWKNRNKSAWRTWYDQNSLLIALGTDAVPQLAAILRNERNAYLKAQAVIILCDMDRFIPIRDSVFPDENHNLRVDSMDVWGDVSPYLALNGRRIGKEGLDALQWASEQTDNSELMIYARICTGKFQQDVAGFSIEQQLQQWKSDAKKTMGGLDLRSVEHYRFREMSAVLVERAPEAIPALTDLLEKERNPMVREAAIRLLRDIDLYRVRLRGSEAGKHAIAAVEKAFERGKLAPVYRDPAIRHQASLEFSDEVMRDQWTLMRGYPLYLIARGFTKFYGDAVVIPGAQADPAMRRFITYLTDIDPDFPSWQYSSYRDLMTLHPDYIKKIERYHEHWVRFKARVPLGAFWHPI